jgi:hypothetical protein
MLIRRTAGSCVPSGAADFTYGEITLKSMAVTECSAFVQLTFMGLCSTLSALIFIRVTFQTLRNTEFASSFVLTLINEVSYRRRKRNTNSGTVFTFKYEKLCLAFERSGRLS